MQAFGHGILLRAVEFHIEPAVIDSAGYVLEHKGKVWGKVLVDDIHLARNLSIR